MRKKIVNVLIVLCLIFALTAGLQNIFVFAAEDNFAEEKFFCTATVNDDFTDDCVLIVLNKQETMQFKTYSVEDFPEVDCEAVIELTESTSELLQKQLKNDGKGLSETSLKIDEDNYRKILLIKLKEKSKENVISAIKQLEKRNEICSAEPNYIGKGDATVAKPFFRPEDQWGLAGTYGIQAPEAWYYQTGKKSIIVGVIDSGIDFTHQDLKNRMYTKNSSIESLTLHRNFLGGEVNGIGETTPTDVHGHGTSVAGVIGAECRSSTSASGVCWDVSLVSLKAFDSRKKFNWLHIINAVNFATAHNIPILNMSGGGYGEDTIETRINAMKTAINNYPGLFVCSAGNKNLDVDIYDHYPSQFSDETNNQYSSFSNRVISVAAIQEDGNIWYKDKFEGSNFGKKTVSLFAPGKNILTTKRYGGYRSCYGTSFAAPHVTGVAALLMSMDNTLTPAEIKTIICNSVDKDERLSDLFVTGGRLNAYKALLQLADKDENGYYFEEFDYQNFSMYHNINLNTICCRPDGSYEVMDNEQSIIGGFNGMSVSLCEMTGKKINFSEWTFFESELVIYTQGIVNSGCYVYDDNGNYLDECTFSMDEGALHVPLNELFNRNLSSFLLIPGYAEESGGWSGTYTVGFSPSDVYLNLFARKYV